MCRAWQEGKRWGEGTISTNVFPALVLFATVTILVSGRVFPQLLPVFFLQQLPNFFGNSGVFSCSGSEVFFCNLEVFFATVPRYFLQRFWPAFLATVGW